MGRSSRKQSFSITPNSTVCVHMLVYGQVYMEKPEINLKYRFSAATHFVVLLRMAFHWPKARQVG